MPERVFALDLATRTGYAFGPPNQTPISGAWDFRKQDRGKRFAFLRDQLLGMWRAETPDLVVCEAPFNLQAFRKYNVSSQAVRVTYGLHGVVEELCSVFDLKKREVEAQVVRKHFIGRANLGERGATKRAVIQRCHQIGLLPKDVKDDDRADAIAIWDWGVTHILRKPPKVLAMFGGSDDGTENTAALDQG